MDERNDDGGRIRTIDENDGDIDDVPDLSLKIPVHFLSHLFTCRF